MSHVLKKSSSFNYSPAPRGDPPCRPKLNHLPSLPLPLRQDPVSHLQPLGLASIYQIPRFNIPKHSLADTYAVGNQVSADRSVSFQRTFKNVPTGYPCRSTTTDKKANTNNAYNTLLESEEAQIKQLERHYAKQNKILERYLGCNINIPRDVPESDLEMVENRYIATCNDLPDVGQTIKQKLMQPRENEVLVARRDLRVITSFKPNVDLRRRTSKTLKMRDQTPKHNSCWTELLNLNQDTRPQKVHSLRNKDKITAGNMLVRNIIKQPDLGQEAEVCLEKDLKDGPMLDSRKPDMNPNERELATSLKSEALREHVAKLVKEKFESLKRENGNVQIEAANSAYKRIFEGYNKKRHDKNKDGDKDKNKDKNKNKEDKEEEEEEEEIFIIKVNRNKEKGRKLIGLLAEFQSKGPE